jgi:hypothetical protein
MGSGDPRGGQEPDATRRSLSEKSHGCLNLRVSHLCVYRIDGHLVPVLCVTTESDRIHVSLLDSKRE